MRLAQLARKIRVKPTELINFISNRFDHKINSTPNTIIPKEYLAAIVEHYVLEKESTLSIKEKSEEASLNIEDGVIRAPKVKVEGVTVVGKIDLPTPPAPQEEEKETVDEDKKEVSSRTRRTTQQKKRRGKTPLSFEEKKKKEEQKYREALKKKKELEKKKRRAHYEALQKERKKTQKPKKKKITKAQQIQQQVEEERKNRPTSLWGRFIYWLNN